jgi:ABC-type polysaccharide/polyol phosphate transport system ATPase subunit
MPTIAARNLTFRYPTFSLQAQSLRSHAMRLLTGSKVHAEAAQVPFIDVFDSISFEFSKGDRVALLGKNGAGKSSLLRVLAGIYTPWSGYLRVSGSIGTLFELGGGMDLDLSGRDNVRRAGLLQGMRVREVEARLKGIEELVQIGAFFDQPVRNYSSGMTMRVAFAMSTLVHPQTFLIDEVYGAGDFEFQQRAQVHLDSLIDGAEVLVFSSHSMDLVRSLCNRGVVMSGGKIVADGPIEEAIAAYLAS